MCNRSVLLALLIATNATVIAATTLTPAGITERIKAVGARTTLETIYSNEEQWTQLLAGIANGISEWLTIATQLHPVSDAGSSEQLVFAVGEALEHRPENVLSLAISEFGIQRVCGGPDVDDARFNSYQLSMEAVAKRQNMLRSIENKSLTQLRDSCIANLEKAKAGIAIFYEVQK
jgi:hypothetical protein